MFLRHPSIIPYGRRIPPNLPLPSPLRMSFPYWYQQCNSRKFDATQEVGMNKIIIREVWAYNLEYEFMLINGLLEKYSFISIDTEFPGVIFKPHNNDHRSLSPAEKYQLLKMNVDALNLIQVGITLSDRDGNLPDLGTNGQKHYCWQFNFCDFNVWRNIYAPDSVALLHHHGMNFSRNAFEGVSSARFAVLAAMSRLLANDALTWVSFHGAYDFGYLVRILTREVLPSRLEDFMLVCRELFGSRVYDVKHLMMFCNGLYGGLECVAEILNVNRAAGKSHQAGSDSLLILQVFHKIRNTYSLHDDLKKYANKLFGID